MTTVNEVRAERLSYLEVQSRIDERSLVFIPLGALEFHGPHLPIGLDGLTAYGVCIATATKYGGVVLPALYQGTGGEHSNYPWTLMMSSPEHIREVLLELLERLEELGVETAVLLSGHFAPEQRAFLSEMGAAWNAVHGRQLRLVALSVAEFEASPVEPDHAATFESLLLEAVDPGLVHLEKLPDPNEFPSEDPDNNPFGAHRHERSHALWGAFGPDPRNADLREGKVLLEAYVDWMGSLI